MSLYIQAEVQKQVWSKNIITLIIFSPDYGLFPPEWSRHWTQALHPGGSSPSCRMPRHTSPTHAAGCVDSHSWERHTNSFRPKHIPLFSVRLILALVFNEGSQISVRHHTLQLMRSWWPCSVWACVVIACVNLLLSLPACHRDFGISFDCMGHNLLREALTVWSLLSDAGRKPLTSHPIFS